jgi:MFS superfamily sulfate permease-like transporter
VLSLGALALSPLGADAARVGAVAAFTTAAIGGLVYGALAGSRLPCGAVTTTSAVMVAAMLATLLRDPALPAEPAARLACVVAAIACTVAVMGWSSC